MNDPKEKAPATPEKAQSEPELAEEKLEDVAGGRPPHRYSSRQTNPGPEDVFTDRRHQKFRWS